MTPKFRAWHKELKQMLPVYKMDWGFTPPAVTLSKENMRKHPIFKLENIELMQWTGLRDIYEGDILKIEDDLDTEIGIVRFSDGGFWVDGPDTEYCGLCHFTECPDYKINIIGNIYENPELLENKS